MSTEQAPYRDVFSIMPGDRLRDGAGQWWTVRSAVASETSCAIDPTFLRLELEREGKVWTMVVRIDPGGKVPQVPMIEGPGWDLGSVRSDSPEAMLWGMTLVRNVLGATGDDGRDGVA